MARSNEAQLIMRLTADNKRMNRALERVERKLGASTDNMNRQWNRGMKRMESRAEKFGRRAGLLIGGAIGASSAALVAATRGTLQFADDLQHLSEQLGVSTDKLQEYYFIASRLGLDQQTINKAFKVATANIGEFATTGAGEAATAMKQLGLDTAILGGEITDVGQILDILIKKLGDEENALVRTGLAAEVFGKRNGAQLSELVGLGSDAIAEMTMEARELGVVLDAGAIKKGSEANDALAKLGDTIKGNIRGELIGMADEIKDIADALTEIVPRLIAWGAEIAKFAVEGARAWGELGDRMARVDTALRLIRLGQPQNAFRILNAPETRTDLELLDEAGKKKLELAKIDRQIIAIRQNAQANGGETRRQQEGIKLLNQQAAPLRQRIELIEMEIQKRKELAAETAKAAKQTIDVEIRTTRTGNTRPSSNLFRDTSAADEAAKKTQEERNKLLEQAKALYEATRTPMEEYQARLAEIAILESDAILTDAAGGQEGIARAKIQNLIELAQATDDYGQAVKQVQALAGSGEINVEQAAQALSQLRDVFDIEQAGLDAVAEKLEAEAELREQKFQALLEEKQLQLELASLAGSIDEIERLEKEIDLLYRKNELQRRGISSGQAESIAQGEQDALDIAEQEGQIRSVIQGAASAGFRDGIDGVKDYLSNSLQNAANNMFDRAINSLLDAVFQGFGGIGGGGGGLGGILGSVFAGLLDAGGVIGARKIGIVGERGPELIASGPQPIRVMGRLDTQRAMNTAGAMRGAGGVSLVSHNYFNGVTREEIMRDVQDSQKQMKRQLDTEFNSKVQRYNFDRSRGVAA